MPLPADREWHADPGVRLTVERIEAALAFAVLAVGGLAAGLRSAPVPIMLAVLIVVGGGVEWACMRKLGEDSRHAGNRLLLLVGLALALA